MLKVDVICLPKFCTPALNCITGPNFLHNFRQNLSFLVFLPIQAISITLPIIGNDRGPINKHEIDMSLKGT